jgi:hypothetical protein
LVGLPALRPEKENAYYSYLKKLGKLMENCSDTAPFADRILVEGYRNMKPELKLKQVTILTQTIQRMALARLQKQYPKMTLREQKLRLASLWLPRETMIKHFNWDPKEMGY